MKIIRFLSILIVVSALSLAHAGIEVQHDPMARFARYRTFAWKDGLAAPKPETEQWIIAAVEAHLVAKGLVKAGPDEPPDLLVATYAFGEMELRTEGHYFVSPTWTVGVMSVNQRLLTTGTLMVELLDAGTGEAVWRATAREAIVQKPAKIRRKIDKITDKMFKNFPPEAP